MTEHTCKEFTPGCYRCELNKDEMAHIDQENRDDAEVAWVKYRDKTLRSTSLDRRQIRKREFIAGFLAGRTD